VNRAFTLFTWRVTLHFTLTVPLRKGCTGQWIHWYRICFHYYNTDYIIKNWFNPIQDLAIFVESRLEGAGGMFYDLDNKKVIEYLFKTSTSCFTIPYPTLSIQKNYCKICIYIFIYRSPLCLGVWKCQIDINNLPKIFYWGTC